MIDDNIQSAFLDFILYEQTDEFKRVESQYREQYLDKRRALNRKGSDTYRQTHPEFVEMRARASKHKAALYQKQHGLCFWCGKPLGERCEIDHIQALTQGGSNDIANLCVAHRRCNRVKYTKNTLDARKIGKTPD